MPQLSTFALTPQTTPTLRPIEFLSDNRGSVLGRILSRIHTIEDEPIVVDFLTLRTRKRSKNFCPHRGDHGAYVPYNHTCAFIESRGLQPCVDDESSTDYEKLEKEYFANNIRELEEARKFQRCASMYWDYCVAFEFPKVYDKDAMEAAAKHLSKAVPREDLEKLIESASKRGLLEGSFRVPATERSSSMKWNSRGKRHYVLGKRGVRQQDSTLAMEGESQC